MRKRMSLKQLEANRLNAQKSTGPKTVRGRAISKRNSLKYGIYSKEVLVRGLKRKESGRELASLHERFRESLDPVGPVEEMLVDQIVTAHWRLRRALTAESGEIALSVDKGYHHRGRPEHPTLQWMEWERLGDPIWYMQESVWGNRLLARILEQAKEAVECEGELSETIVQNVVKSFQGKPNCLTHELEAFRLKLQANPDGLEPAALREKNKQSAMDFLKQKLRGIAWDKEKCEEADAIQEESRQAAAVLPSMETIEKILRYERKLERQMFRAMAQLERLQRMRGGESIAAPVSVVVSEKEDE